MHAHSLKNENCLTKCGTLTVQKKESVEHFIDEPSQYVVLLMKIIYIQELDHYASLFI